MRREIISAAAALILCMPAYSAGHSPAYETVPKDTVSATPKARKPVKYNEKGEIIKTGYNFGPLPVVAFDADRGFQFGGLLNIYNFGNGSTYPEPKSHWYIEASAYVKNGSIGTHKYILAYDRKNLTPGYNLRLCAAGTLYFDTALNFYGFNGYQSFYDSTDPSGFYRHSRTTASMKVDLIGEIAENFFWEAGYHFDWFRTGQYRDFYKNTPADGTEPEALIDLYRQWGIIPEEQFGDAVSSALRLGFFYDSRDVEASPSKGIWAEAHLITAPRFLGSSTGYNKVNVTFRHYIPIYRDKVVFAYRLNYQGFLGNTAPWYVLPYYTIVGKNYDYDGIGGYRTVRGILQNRVQGRHTGFFNAELRYRFIDFRLWNQNIAFAVSGFCDGTGVLKGMDLTNRTGYRPDLYEKYIDTSRPDRLHLAAGGGLRFIMNRNFIVAFEYAYSISRQDNKGGAFYINTGFLF